MVEVYNIDFNKPNAITEIADKVFENCLKNHKKDLKIFISESMQSVNIKCSNCGKEATFQNGN